MKKKNKRRKAEHHKREVSRKDTPAYFYYQPGEILEAFCEQRDVSMNGIIPWSETYIEAADVCSPELWLEFEVSWESIPFTTPEYDNSRYLPVSLDAFDSMTRRVRADEKYFSPENVYLGTGHFRYEKGPGQDIPGPESFNFAFLDTSNIGLLFPVAGI